jgi:hypothetical protein
MSNFTRVSEPSTELEQAQSEAAAEQSLQENSQSKSSFFKKTKGGLLFVIGYLLSPLSFWNDVFFNLPVAYGFGYLCSWVSQDWFLPGTIAGYWLSNIAGVLLMQFGAVEVLNDQPKERNIKKELLVGVLSSTAYSLVILALVQFKILDASSLFPNGNLGDLSAFLPWKL